MLDFNKLVVKELITEASESDIIAKISSASSFSYPVTSAILSVITAILAKPGRYLAADDFINYVDYVPVLDIICTAVGGKDKAVNEVKSTDFWDKVLNGLNSTPNLIQDLRDIDSGYQCKDPVINSYYINITKKINQNLITATAYAKYSNQTIVKSIIQLIEDRLNTEQQRIITNALKAKSTPAALELFLADLFQHYQEYSTGNKKADPVIEELLHRVGVTYEKLINIVVLTIQYYKSLAQKAVSDPTVSAKHNTPDQQKIVIENNVKTNVYPNFAVNGTFVFNF
jgi:hypothetical protein